jgi:hypothetical protein
MHFVDSQISQKYKYLESVGEACQLLARQDKEIDRLKSENERLKDMIYCSDCGDGVEDPHIDKYGEGPFCDICKDQRE